MLLNQNTGTNVTSIHYKGGGEAIKDFLGGHVQAIFGSPLQMMPHVPMGRAKILAITKAKRAEVLPNTPTFLELGFPNMVVDIWTAYIAPAGTPEPMVQKLYTEFARILAMPGLSVNLSVKDGGALEAQEVKAELSQPRMNVGPLQRGLKRIALGEHQYTGPDFMVSGQWQVRIVVLISDFEQAEFAAAVTIPR